MHKDRKYYIKQKKKKLMEPDHEICHEATILLPLVGTVSVQKYS